MTDTNMTQPGWTAFYARQHQARKQADTFDADLERMYQLLNNIETICAPLPEPGERKEIDQALDGIWTAYFNVNLAALRDDNAWQLFPDTDLLAAWRDETATAA